MFGIKGHVRISFCFVKILETAQIVTAPRMVKMISFNVLFWVFFKIALSTPVYAFEYCTDKILRDEVTFKSLPALGRQQRATVHSDKKEGGTHN